MPSGTLPSRSDNFSDWYNQVVLDAELADYAPVRGCMVVRPYGWTLWENIQQALDRRFKETGHVNAAFPLFIPMSFLEKEKEHVEGFAPELAIVTIGGGEKLEEPLVVRPTSETIIGYMYSKWIKSYRDLPVLINQWGNVVRWELRTRLFLRTLEFYWQEGHTAHATEAEARSETRQMLDVYTDFAFTEAAVPVVPGRKSEGEKFMGAVNSYTIEAMMGDKRALQAGTSHFLGQNFSRAFEIKYLDANNQLQYVWTTSWGLSTRFVGAIIMTHGDDQGLVLPPKLAPIQVVVVAIYRNQGEKSQVMAAVESLRSRLKLFRAYVDAREELTPGYKYNDWELRGVPLRIEIGPRDVAHGTVTLARRDVPGKDGKRFISQDQLESQVAETLRDIQIALFDRALAFRKANTFEPKDYADLREIVQDAWAFAWWCSNPHCEAKVKEDTKATTRCIPFDQPGGSGRCIYCGEHADEKVIFSRAY
ncbi:MAG TPA: proline--tRNA ligase [Anaerolineales bacterium]|nr:proline--tRNA ligase [Anaerolineales bacterium]